MVKTATVGFDDVAETLLDTPFARGRVPGQDLVRQMLELTDHGGA
jgi:hypothetical protein